MDIAQFRTWLASIDEQLVEAVVADVAAHVSGLDDAHRAFYGYAVLPSDDFTCGGPPNVSVAYNLETDIDSENEGSDYDRGSSGIFVARCGRFRASPGVECRDGNTLSALCPASGDRRLLAG